MYRRLLFLFALIGILFGDLRAACRSWREMRSSGIRAYFKLRFAMAQLVTNLGPVEATKLVRLICGIVFEISPHASVLAHALGYAAQASGPAHGKSVTEIAATVHRVARQVAGIESHAVTATGGEAHG